MTTDAARQESRLESLVGRLRAMTRLEHDDLSIGDEAADEIERLLKAAELGEQIYQRAHDKEGPMNEWWHETTCELHRIYLATMTPNAGIKPLSREAGGSA